VPMLPANIPKANVAMMTSISMINTCRCCFG
jgi:hypothetical protein